jgi:ribosome-associated translation inhibitor RaiA
MLVLVHTDNHIQGDDRLKEYTEEVIEGAMDRFGNRITRVEVQFSDQDSREKTKGNDKRCVLEARLAGLQPLTVSHDADKVKDALHGAVDKLEKLIANTIEKHIDSQRRAAAVVADEVVADDDDEEGDD